MVQSALSDFTNEGDHGLQWPVFKWAGGASDSYFARMSTNQISVYEASSMLLLDKKSLKLEGVKEFEWSPTDNILSVYQPEIGNQAARISLIAIPSRCGSLQHPLVVRSACLCAREHPTHKQRDQPCTTPSLMPQVTGNTVHAFCYTRTTVRL